MDLTNFQNYVIDIEQDMKRRANEIYFPFENSIRRIPLTFQVKIPLQSYCDQVQCICAHCKSASVCSHTLSNSRTNPGNDKIPTGKDNFPPAQFSVFATDFLNCYFTKSADKAEALVFHSTETFQFIEIFLTKTQNLHFCLFVPHSLHPLVHPATLSPLFQGEKCDGGNARNSFQMKLEYKHGLNLHLTFYY